MNSKNLISFHFELELLCRVDALARVMGSIKNRRVSRAQLINRAVREFLDRVESEYFNLSEEYLAAKEAEASEMSTWMSVFKAAVKQVENDRIAEFQEAGIQPGRAMRIHLRLDDVLARIAHRGAPVIGYKELTARYLKNEGYKNTVARLGGKNQRVWARLYIMPDKTSLETPQEF